MKFLILGLVILTSVSAFAEQSTLLLDASCKITCSADLKTRAVEEPRLFERAKDTFYVDYIAKSRSEIDAFLNPSSAQKKFCTEKMIDKYGDNLRHPTDIDVSDAGCLYFKH